MLFKEVIGQQKVKKQLIQTVKDSRVSHALLFIGPMGSGKLALALAYSQYISCENKKEDDSCGECLSCRKFNQLVHPDLHFVFPVLKGNDLKEISDNYIKQWRETILANPYISPNDWFQVIGVSERKQPQIYTAESEEIIRKLNFKTFEGEYKIMIIWLAEKMNNASSNKLLKILEEPPPKTIFILIAEDSSLMLQTILSRTQLIKLSKIDDESLSNSLRKKFSIPELEIQNVVRLANGSFLNAINIIESSDEQNFNFAKFQEVMRLSYGVQILELNKWTEEMAASGREKQKSFFTYCLRMIRENFIMHIQKPELNYMTSEENTFAKKFHPFINEANAQQIAQEFNTAQYHIERNGNPKIIFLDLALKLVKLLKLK